VCRVDSTRWPVCAACTAISAVSPVADLADEDNIRVLAQDRAKRGGKGDAGFLVDLHLVHAVYLVFDGIFYGGYVDRLAADPVEACEQRGKTFPTRLGLLRKPSLRLFDEFGELGVFLVRNADVRQVQQAHIVLENAYHGFFARGG